METFAIPITWREKLLALPPLRWSLWKSLENSDTLLNSWLMGKGRSTVEVIGWLIYEIAHPVIWVVLSLLFWLREIIVTTILYPTGTAAIILAILAYVRIVGVAEAEIIVDEIPIINALPSGSTDRYINEWHAVAIREMHEHGIPASITLAQGILESGNGNSELTRTARNHFGIKCNGKTKWRGDKVYRNDDEDDECFRKYGRDEDSFEDHSLFLLDNDRYDTLFTLGSRNYKSWALVLEDKGYATSKTYAESLIRSIEKYKLYRFDRM